MGESAPVDARRDDLLVDVVLSHRVPHRNRGGLPRRDGKFRVVRRERGAEEVAVQQRLLRYDPLLSFEIGDFIKNV